MKVETSYLTWICLRGPKYTRTHIHTHTHIYIYIYIFHLSVDLPSGLFSIAIFLRNHPYVNKPRTSKGEREKIVELIKQKLPDVHLAVHMAALLQKASLCLLRCSQGAILFGHDNQVTIFFNSLKRFPHPELVPCTAKILGFEIHCRLQKNKTYSPEIPKWISACVPY